jgi:hypothetical protein
MPLLHPLLDLVVNGRLAHSGTYRYAEGSRRPVWRVIQLSRLEVIRFLPPRRAARPRRTRDLKDLRER